MHKHTLTRRVEGIVCICGARTPPDRSPHNRKTETNNNTQRARMGQSIRLKHHLSGGGRWLQKKKNLARLAQLIYSARDARDAICDSGDAAPAFSQLVGGILFFGEYIARLYSEYMEINEWGGGADGGGIVKMRMLMKRDPYQGFIF